MPYDTCHRYEQALSTTGQESLPAALHALSAAAEDCRRAGKPLGNDAAVLLLIRHPADIAEREASSTDTLRLRCVERRWAASAASALLDIAAHPVGRDSMARRTFHAEARRALARLAVAIGLAPDAACVTTTLGCDEDDGTTELRHADLSIRVVPRSFLPDSEITFNRCRNGEHAGPVHRAPLAELLDAAAFQKRLAAAIGRGAAHFAAAV